jgi:transcription elongation GreA/GreB family factor
MPAMTGVAAKELLVEKLVTALRAERDNADRLARETAEAANHPEARPENDKDTRKLELSYLAQGQAARARELEATIAALGAQPPRAFGPDDTIALGALVELESGDKLERVLLCSGGGGASIEDEGGPVRVVTPEAPLGRALMGKAAGDEVELVVAGKKRELVVVSVV